MTQCAIVDCSSDGDGGAEAREVVRLLLEEQLGRDRALEVGVDRPPDLPHAPLAEPLLEDVFAQRRHALIVA